MDPGGVEAICLASLEWAALDKTAENKEGNGRSNPIMHIEKETCHAGSGSR